MSSESYRLSLERRATIDEELRRAALGVLEGEIGVVAASRIFARLRIDVSTAQPEIGEALNLFVAVDSETDALPMGTARELWTPSALEREDQTIAEAEARFREPVRSACQHVLQLLGDDVMILWRPVGPRDLELISTSGMREFPPRLPEQPIFYPVTTEAYAIKIARDWNAPRGGGFVTRFQVRRSFISRYSIHIAGGRENMEYWIPAEDLVEFNGAIVGEIEIVAEFPNRE